MRKRSRVNPVIAAIVAMVSPCLLASEPQDEKECVLFDGKVLLLAFENTTLLESVKEYVPEGESLEKWTHLASVRTYPKHKDPKLLATNVARLLKQKHPNAPFQLLQNPATGEVVIDFVMWPDDLSFVEFNVFKYAANGPNETVTAQQYAIRDYEDGKKFLKELKPARERLVGLMAKEGLTFRSPNRESPTQENE